MIVFWVLIFLNNFLISNILAVSSSETILVHNWKCIDKKCSLPISDGEVQGLYSVPNDSQKLKLVGGQKVLVFRKAAENDVGKDFWWVEVNEKRSGYANKRFIREKKMHYPNHILVDVNISELDATAENISSESPNEADNYKNVSTSVDTNNNLDKSVISGISNENNTGPPDESNHTVNVSSEVNGSFPLVNRSELEPPNEIDNKSKLENSGNILGQSLVTQPKVDENTVPELFDKGTDNTESITNSSYSEPTRVTEKDSSSLVSKTKEIGSTVNDKTNSMLNKHEGSSITTLSSLSGSNSGSSLPKTAEVRSNNANVYHGDKGSDPNVTQVENDKLDRNQINKTNVRNITDNNLDYQESNNSFDASNDIKRNILETNPNEATPDQNESISTENKGVASNLSTTENIAPVDNNITASLNTNPSETNHESTTLTKKTNTTGFETLTTVLNESNYEGNSVTGINTTSLAGLNNNSQDKDPLENTSSQETKTTTQASVVSPLDSNQQRTDEANKIVPESSTVTPEGLNNNSLKDTSSQDEETSTQGSTDFPNDYNHQSTSEHHKTVPESSTLSPVLETTPTTDKQEIIENLESLLPSSNETNETENLVSPINSYENEDSTTSNNSHENNNYGDANKQPETIHHDIDNSDKDIHSIHDPSLSPKDNENRNVNKNDEEVSQMWFSSVHSLMDSLRELYTNSLGNIMSQVEIPSSEMKEDHLPTYKEIYHHDENAEPIVRNEKEPDSGRQYSHTYKGIDDEPETVWSNIKSLLWLVGSAIVILTFSLGYYYLENLRRDGELVLKNNVLSSEIFVLEREKINLEDDFMKLKGNMQRYIDENSTFNEQLFDLKENLQKTKEEKTIVEEREAKLIKKLMMIEQNYNELRKLFSESKQKGERATLTSDIKKLKESIVAGNIEISSLKEELQEKKNESKLLNKQLQKTSEAKAGLEERIEKMVLEHQEITTGFQQTLSKLEQTIEDDKIVQSKLENELRKQKKECESMLIQKELAESSLQKAHGLTSTESLSEWLQVKEAKSSLIKAEKEIFELKEERNNLGIKLEGLEENNESLKEEVKQLTNEYENAEKEKIEALTKLQVLSNYFKEKEIELQEELGVKEAQWLQKQSDDNTIYQQMKDLRDENLSLKTMVETLKKEMLNAESTYKKIVNTTEQKAHENWVSFRHAEVRLKEAQAEAAQLRNRLTTLETCDDNSERKLNKTVGLEVNGDLPSLSSAMSPPFMLYPNEFIPPPPLIPPPPAGGNPSSRPPPLGRISSPPLVSGDFIPPPPILAPYDVYPHLHQSPPSPPIPSLLHKPQPRDHHIAQPPQVPPSRKQKDSQSSNHSSESPLDKTPPRRSKR